MKQQNALNWLVPLLGIISVLAFGTGLFSQTTGQPFPFTTLHGQTVEMYGRGLYQFDTFFKAPILRGTDAVYLFLCLPLLGIAFALYRRDSLRGGIFLTGMLAVFLYNFASMAFGAAYNNMFLAYLAGFSASLFALVLAFTSIDIEALAERISPELPRRGIAIFIAFAGSSVLVWLIEIVGGLISGHAPESLASYTTDVTAVLDIGIIAPLAWLTCVLLFRRTPLGYLLAPVLLILNAIIGVIVIAQTVAQALAGITLSTGQYIGFVGSFVILSLIALWFITQFFRNITN
jgi:hypothetical protein